MTGSGLIIILTPAKQNHFKLKYARISNKPYYPCSHFNGIRKHMTLSPSTGNTVISSDATTAPPAGGNCIYMYNIFDPNILKIFSLVQIMILILQVNKQVSYCLC